MSDLDTVAERELLAEALEVAAASVTLVSREPLGAGSVVGFDVAQQPGSDPLRYYVDTSKVVVETETGMVLGEGAAPEARIWLHPADPHLSVLPALAFHDAAEQLLARLGITDAQPPVFVAYRPGRRAVLFAEATAKRVWMKVVQARRVERIVEMHAACARAGLPVPATLGWSPAGVILLENAAGTPVADAPWQPGPLLDRVDELRTRIAQVDISRPVRGVAERLDWYEQRLIGRPAVADVAIGADVTDVADIARRVRDLLAAGGAGRTPRVVHGDLHFGQLFLDGDAVSGLIDIDTMGVGDEAEDPAAFLAHATVSALLTPIGHRARVWELADLGCDRWAPDQAVRALFAVHMLGHALAAADTDDEALVQTLLRAARAVLDGGAPSECQSPADSKKPLTVSYFSA